MIATWKLEVRKQNCVLLFNCFNLKGNYDVLKSKSPCFFSNKDINFNKIETESRIANPTHISKMWNLCLSSNKNCESIVKLRWVGARKKKIIFFETCILSEGIFCSICILSQCIEQNFQNICTFTYQKTLLRILLLLVFKIAEGLQCILKLQSLTPTCSKVY